MGSCSVVPELSDATGRQDNPVFIADVVTRVKCEIADSFDELRPYHSFDWVQSWAAKVDLTLQANTQAGIAPSGSYTKFQKNAFNYDAGSSSLTSNTIASVAQFFTLSAGANVGEQALRTEVVSFSVGIDELHDWRKAVAKWKAIRIFHQNARFAITVRPGNWREIWGCESRSNPPSILCTSTSCGLVITRLWGRQKVRPRPVPSLRRSKFPVLPPAW